MIVVVCKRCGHRLTKPLSEYVDIIDELRRSVPKYGRFYRCPRCLRIIDLDNYTVDRIVVYDRRSGRRLDVLEVGKW